MVDKKAPVQPDSKHSEFFTRKPWKTPYVITATVEQCEAKQTPTVEATKGVSAQHTAS